MSSTVISEHESGNYKKLVISLDRDTRGRHQIRVTWCGRSRNGGWFEQRSVSFLPSEAVTVSCALDRAMDRLAGQRGDNS